MPKSPDRIRKIAADIVGRNVNLHDMQSRYEAMGRLDYQLPKPLSDFEWVRPIVDTAPYDAKRGVKRALANLMLNINIHPVTVINAVDGDDESKAAKLKANEWETVLKWTLQRLAKRKAAFYDSVIDSACTYHEIVGRLIHMPTQFKLLGDSGARNEAALRFGDWAIQLINPQNANIDYSDYMPERAVFLNKKTARQIVDFWGDKASAIQRKINKNEEYAEEVLVEVDYIDYEDRMVWIIEENSRIEDDEGDMILSPEPWMTFAGEPVPFLPVIAVAGGTDIDLAPEHQRTPLFYPIVMAEDWINSNIMGTIEMSRAIATAAAPEGVLTSPRSEEIEMTYGEPGEALRLMPGETYEQLRQLGLDPAIMEARDRRSEAIKRSTVADILVTGQPMGGVEAFAAYNLQVQIAISSLGDYKNLGERFYEDAVEKMLLMTHYSGGKISGYGEGLDKYVIDSEEIDPDVIYVDVELKTDVPVDRQQRITSALQMADRIPYDPVKILEFLGESDPEGAIRGYKLWQMDQADMSGRLQRIQAEATGELEQLRQMVGMMQEQMSQMAQQGEPGRGVEGVEGEGFNPAEGGIPPAMAAPGATREMQSGQDRYGNTLVQPGVI